MESTISGTIVAVRRGQDHTDLRIVSGDNGTRRIDRVRIPGEYNSIEEGRAIRLANFVRTANGVFVPGESAKLTMIKPAPASPAADLPPPPTNSPASAARLQEEHALAATTAPATPPRANVAYATPEVPAELASLDHAVPALQPAEPAPAALTRPDHQPGGLMTFSAKATRRAIFNRAVEVAREFADHIRKSGQIIKIQNRDYVTVAGWSLLPAFESANCYTVAYQIGEDGTAYAEAVVEKDGVIASRGFGACSEKDRPKINDRLAMAQTRARGSALKSRYSVLVTLAGYEASLADEVHDATDSHTVKNETKPPVITRAKPPAQLSTPTPDQIAFALRIFENDHPAILKAATEHHVIAYEIADIPVSVLKRIVEQRINDRKRRRTESAAAQAA